MTLCGERNDLEATLALLSSLGYDAVHLIGGSMGGAVVSTMDYTRLPMVQSLTLWFPVMDFGRMSADFFSPAHREEAMRTGAAEIHSLRNGTVYHLGRDLFEEVSGRQPEEYLQSVQLPKLFVHGTGDTIVPWEQSRDACAHCPNSELVLVKDGTHSFSGSQRELNEAIDATLQFLLRVRARI